MKFTSDSYALLSPLKNELKIVLHFCMVLSLSLLVEKREDPNKHSRKAREN